MTISPIQINRNNYSSKPSFKAAPVPSDIFMPSFNKYKSEIIQKLSDNQFLDKKYLKKIQSVTNYVDLNYVISHLASDFFYKKTETLLSTNPVIMKYVRQNRMTLAIEQFLNKLLQESETALEQFFKLLVKEDTNPEIIDIKDKMKNELGIEELHFDNDLDFANASLDAMRLLKSKGLKLPKQIIGSRFYPDEGAFAMSHIKRPAILSSLEVEPNWMASVEHRLHKLVHEGIHFNQINLNACQIKKLNPTLRKIADDVSCYADGNYTHEVHAELLTKKILGPDVGVELTPDEEYLLKYLNNLLLI